MNKNNCVEQSKAFFIFTLRRTPLGIKNDQRKYANANNMPMDIVPLNRLYP